MAGKTHGLWHPSRVPFDESGEFQDKRVGFGFFPPLIQCILYEKEPNAFGTKSKLCIDYCYWVLELGSHYVPRVAGNRNAAQTGLQI